MAHSADGKTLELDGVRVWFDAREGGLQISLRDAQLERELKSSLNSPAMVKALTDLLGQHKLPNGEMTVFEPSAAEAQQWLDIMAAAVPARLAAAQMECTNWIGLALGDEITITTWAIPQGAVWTEYADYRDQIAQQMRAGGHRVADLAIMPVGRTGDDGSEVIGTIGGTHLRIWHSSKSATWRRANEYTQEMYGRAVVVPLLRELGCGDALMMWCGLMTKPFTSHQVFEVRVTNVNVHRMLNEDFLAQFRDRLGVQWARVLDQIHLRDGTYILAFGDDWRGREREFAWVHPYARTIRQLHMGEYGVLDPQGRNETRDPNWWRPKQ